MDHCRFRDCKHDREPGCAVRAAIEDGSLDPDRFASLERLVAEEVALEAEQRAKLKTADRRRGGRPAPDAVESRSPKTGERLRDPTLSSGCRRVRMGSPTTTAATSIGP